MKARILDWLFIIVMAIACAAFVISFTNRVQAAPASTAPECDEINRAGAIIVYRCQPYDGPSYLLNSFGFMVVED